MQTEMFDNPERDALLQKRRALLGDSWFMRLAGQFEEPYMKKLGAFLAQRRVETVVYPTPEDVFRAYQLTPYENTKVVFIAQDPYNDGTATGVAMGVRNPQIYPKTVDILDDAIAEDLYGGFRMQPIDPDLEYLCAQGVLLINAALTVEHKQPGSHQGKGWANFIKATIQALNEKDFVIYLLLGSHGQQFRDSIADKHVVLEVEHPIKHKYEKRPKWIHNRPFSKINQLLTNNQLQTINW